MGEILYYKLSNDKLGLMRFEISDQENEFSYRVHSNEMTKLEIWIHSMLQEKHHD